MVTGDPSSPYVTHLPHSSTRIPHDVRTQLEGPLQQRRGEDVVDDHLRSRGVRELAHGCDVDQLLHRVGR